MTCLKILGRTDSIKSFLSDDDEAILYLIRWQRAAVLFSINEANSSSSNNSLIWIVKKASEKGSFSHCWKILKVSQMIGYLTPKNAGNSFFFFFFFNKYSTIL